MKKKEIKYLKKKRTNFGKRVCVFLLVVFTLAMAADIANYFLTPAWSPGSFGSGGSGFSMPETGDFQMPENGDFQMPEGEDFQRPEAGGWNGETDSEVPDIEGMPSFEGGPGVSSGGRQSSFRQTVRSIWLPILIVCILGDVICLILLLRMRKKERALTEALAAPPEMSPLEDEEDPDEPPKRKRGPWTAILCLVIAFAMILAMIPTEEGDASSANVHQEVRSGTAEAAEIQTVLSGAGTLEADSLTAVTVPQQVTVLKYHVRNGETVIAGDPLVSVDKTSASSAMLELSEALDDLDDDLEVQRQASNSSYLYSTAAGRVKKIYTSVGDKVTDVLYEHGALLLLSLDGLMKVRFESQLDLTVGDTVTVQSSSGSEEGRIASIRQGNVTVTLSDEDMGYGTEVTVLDESGKTIGAGALEINSELKVIGYYGTVKSLSVKVGDKVSVGTTLLTLEDTGYTTDYQILLARREELEAQMQKLSKLAQTGMVYAEKDGIVSGVPDNAEIELLSGSGTGKANTLSASSGGWQLILLSNVTETEPEPSQNTEETKPPQGVDETVPATTSETTAMAISEEPTATDEFTELLMTTYAEDDEPANSEPEATEESTETQPITVYYAACITGVEDSRITVQYFTSDGLTADSDPAQYQGQMNNTGTFTLSLTNPKAGDYLLLAITGETVSVIKHIPVTTTEPEPVPTLRNGTYAASFVSVSADKLYLWLTADPVTDAAVDLTSLQAQMTQFGECAYSGISGADIPLTENGESKIVKLNELKQNDLLLVTFTDGIVTSIVKAQRVSSGTPGQSGGVPGGDMPSDGVGDMPSGGMDGMSGGMPSGGSMPSGGGMVQQETYDQYIVEETELLYVSDQQEISVTISVDELDILSLETGLDAQVTLDAAKGQSFAGKIQRIGHEGSNDGGNTKFAVTVTLPREAAMLDGMNASIKVVTATKDAAVAIPAAALIEDDGKTYVYTAYDSDTDTLDGLTEVETGASDGEMVEILSGLEMGDTFYYRYADTVTYSFLTGI